MSNCIMPTRTKIPPQIQEKQLELLSLDAGGLGWGENPEQEYPL